MPFELTVGLLVVDPEKYAQYRSEIAPLLEAAGARFRYDFEVARSLKSEAGHDINRLLVIQFLDRALFPDCSWITGNPELVGNCQKGADGCLFVPGPRTEEVEET